MRRLLVVAAATAAMLVPASQALASHNPTGAFAVFDQCPVNNPEVLTCLFSETNGGFFQMGEKTVPLKNPVILQGGLAGLTFVGAENGETLSKTPQPVPGGLLGIEAPGWWPGWLQSWFNNKINEGLTGVDATVELAAPASAIKVNTVAILLEAGTALSLPIKVKLDNAILGSNCYIGSNANPIVIDFTSGETSPPPPNEPIHGSAGTPSINEGIITLSGGQLVNNSFAAPEADGCGGLFSFFIDPLVNDLIGLPSPAGTNTAILEGKLQSTAATAVVESEE